MEHVSQPVETKTRRLAPQFALTKEELASDNSKSKIPSEIKKPSVLRFTREQLIGLRKPYEILPSMGSMSEINSYPSLDPVCFSKLEPEDVIKIWNSSKDVAGRGRGRARSFNKQDENGEKSLEEDSGKKTDLWDDEGLGNVEDGKGFDLADFSAASIKFRLDLNNDMNKPSSIVENRTLDDLIEKEPELSNIIQLSNEDPIVQSFESSSLSNLTSNNFVGGFDSLNLFSGSGNLDIPFNGSRIESLNFDDSKISFSNSIPEIPLELPKSYLASVAVGNPFFPTETPIVESEWFYTDPQHQIQGPFSQSNMKMWNDAGYFDKDLPIKLKNWKKFHKFHEIFPDVRFAFDSFPLEPNQVSSNIQSTSQVLPQVTSEVLTYSNEPSVENSHPSIESSTQMKKDKNQKNAVEVSSQQQKIDFSSTNNKSTFAKQLLGINSKKNSNLNDDQESKFFDVSQSEASKVKDSMLEKLSREQVAKQETKIEKSDKPKGWNTNTGSNRTAISLANIQIQQKQETEIVVEKSDKSDKPKGWNTQKISVSHNPISLANIQLQQKEEASSISPLLPVLNTNNTEVQSKSTQPKSATPMTVQLKSLLGVKGAIESPKPAWQSPTPDQSQSQSLAEIMNEEINQQKKFSDESQPSFKSTIPNSWASKAARTTGSTAVSPVQTTLLSKQSTVPIQEKSVPGPKVSVNENAIQKAEVETKLMSKEMTEWCTSQLKKLNGSQDLTLLEFCMTLKSSVEIREYLSDYLGSTPQVTNFATEFIKLKEGKKSKSSQAPKSFKK